KCPLCQRPSSPNALVPNHTVRHVVGELRARCPEDGCGEVVEVQNFVLHRRDCTTRTTTCPKGCGREMLKKEKGGHDCVKYLTEECEALRQENQRLRDEKGHLRQENQLLRSEELQAMDILMCFSLQEKGKFTLLMGNTGVIEFMIVLISNRIQQLKYDETLEEAWGILWNVTDEAAENCERFLDKGGMDQFMACFK
ncbi:unnamed protein product, partial [Cyprideis torosa]